MSIDIDHLRTWIGRSRSAEDTATAWPVAALTATLDREEAAPRPGEALPQGWHWLYFLEAARQSLIGPDGHPRRGDFYPPVPLPRRMYVGNKMTFHRPLRVGEALRRTSRIGDVTAKEGRSGALVFLTIVHEISGAGGLAVTEEQSLVFRGEDASGSASGGGSDPDTPKTRPWTRTLQPDPVMLFRFSALTFNGHRIHYDQPYTTKVEGHRGVIVHGPLTAILLLDLVRRFAPGRALATFGFRTRRPFFVDQPLTLVGVPEGQGVGLFALTPEGLIGMRGEVSFA
ncbi:MAG: acyl-CoA dehydrogenase [Alphaproteobacteria bacterium]|nr:acyl-CoA dehydrogenase [Alphaproteobacteria bacterium]